MNTREHNGSDNNLDRASRLTDQGPTRNTRHPAEMGAAEINQFLTDLAVHGHVSASTQNQAFSALLLLYQQVLQVPLEQIQGVVRANRPRRLPVVLSREEVRLVFSSLDGVPLLICSLLYGAGLPLFLIVYAVTH